MDFILEQVGFSCFSAQGVKVINEQKSNSISFSTIRADVLVRGENMEVISLKNQLLEIRGQIKGIDLEKRKYFKW